LNARSAMVTEPVGDTEKLNSYLGSPIMVTFPTPGPRMERCLPIFSQPVKRRVPCKPASKVMVLPEGALSIAQRSEPVPLSCKVVTRVGSGGSCQRSQPASPAVARRTSTMLTTLMPYRRRARLLASRKDNSFLLGLLRLAQALASTS